jgi:hypothetical protein
MELEPLQPGRLPVEKVDEVESWEERASLLEIGARTVARRMTYCSRFTDALI